MSIEVVAVEDLSFRYEDRDVVSHVSFSVEAGDYVGLVGPNGSGKSTLVRLILGLETPASGKIFLFGKPLPDLRQRHRIGYLPQANAAFKRFFPATVKEIVALGLTPKRPGSTRRDHEQSIERAMRIMDIVDIKDKLIGQLSGGQQQRVLLARALVRKPDLLILDEPTISIDPEIRERLLVILMELNQEEGITVLLVTHDTSSIGKYAKKLLYLEKEIIFYGGFDQFCLSEEMTRVFGAFSQHLICHRHG